MKPGSMLLAVLVAVALAVPVALRGQDHAPIGSKLPFEINAVSRTLPNGLPLVVMEKPGTGMFEGLVGCLGGYAFDPPGGSGTAHLTEHVLSGIMMSAIGPPPDLRKALAMEYSKTRGADSERSKALEAEIVKMTGRGDWNIGTTADLVYYGVQSCPSEWLERFILASAEILNVTPPEQPFEVQRQSLVDEVKKKIAADDRGRVTSPHVTTVFPANHPYGAAVGARLADVEHMTIESVRAFKAAYYQPARCAVVVVGDVRPPSFFSIAETRLGSVRSGTPTRNTRPEPPRGERRATIESASGPSLHITFVKPSMPAPDNSTAEVVASLLGGGKDSRLSRQLVDAGVATTAAGGNGGPGQLYDDMLSFHVKPASGHDVEEIEAVVLRELDRLKTEPVPAAELRAAIEQADANTASFYKDGWSLVLGLLRYQLIAGDWKALAKAVEAYRRVTPDEIVAFARTYFIVDNRSVLKLVKTK